MASRNKIFTRRRNRVRNHLKKVSNGRPRLSVFRSGRHIYAQIINDETGATVASASTLEKDLRSKAGVNTEAAAKVGHLIAERAKAAGVETVVFDRGGFIFHGRVRSLAEAARESGLQF
ncbi:MAG: 50S ribosomal protein L18 [SAR116 cluster bacterium]|nr:50S ribosomal protein L18 [Paracoccaceae bacterium]RCL80560.1 MAG: 50S ribosomal protein L18 [SAR116 cluster bacterium]HBQ22810.1 50S ribosomal protein L18 [Alphaproteobacteria bacterium]HCJ61095.1 50S ribosomal protein L18 [Alphaproteobacteria bacterium]|tara:strand:+ start:1161 stop:1517 length:357 start_codon:yes stop_codon:yes gene_type:complete